MPRRLLPRQPLHSRLPFYVALGLLVLSVLIFFASGVLYYTLFRETSEDQIAEQLRGIAFAAEPAVAQRAEFALVALADAQIDAEDDSEWTAWFESFAEIYREPLQQLVADLNDLRERTSLSGLLLLSPEGRVIADSESRFAPGSTPPAFVSVEIFAFENAAQGRFDNVPYYEIEGAEPVKRAYCPVRIRAPETLAGSVGAVLCLETSFDALAATMSNLRAQGILLLGIVTVLMLIVALAFYRLIRLFARIEERAAHQDRLQAMGTLTAGIAHEIRNPLGIIRALAEGLRGDLESTHPARELLDDILDEVARLNRLVTQYLEFARPDAPLPGEEARPDEILPALVALLEKNVPNALPPVELAIEGDVPAVRMKESALRQVLLNLLMNAREASTESSGAIRVRCDRARAGSQVEIEVEDRGHGIAPKDLKRVFEPFFTTREKGSGLGLAVCRRIVTECGGTIDVRSRSGEGTTVRVVLPASDAKPPEEGGRS
ncbi:ATP-binding protein [Candidatus Sumerlaeota bacterium]|nr:ATP-binding protein [Candidatus Sumerlaeota bacterium]